MQNSEVLKFLILRIFSRKFDRIKRPDSIGPINIEQIDLGKEMIKIKEIFMESTHNENEVIGEAQITYSGGASLTLSTEFYVNFPRWHFAVIPVNAKVVVKSLSGRIMVYGPPEIWSRFSLSFLELPQCDFDVRLTVGSKHKYDVSKFGLVSDFIVSNLKKILWKNTVIPNRITFALPLPGKKIQIQTKQLTSKRKQRTTEEMNGAVNVNTPIMSQPNIPTVVT